jgi:hypothetical protein
MHWLLSVVSPFEHKLHSPRLVKGRVVVESTWSRELRYRGVISSIAVCTCGRVKSSTTCTKKFSSYDAAAAATNRRIANLRCLADVEFNTTSMLSKIWKRVGGVYV